MLAVGRERAARKRLDRRVDLRRGQCRGAALRGRPLRRRHDRLRHPQRAAHRPGARRSLPRAEAGRALLCLEFSAVDVAGARPALRALFLQRHPARSARVVAGDAEPYRYLVESIRRFPEPGALRRDDRAMPASRASTIATSPAASPRSIPAGSSERRDGGHRSPRSSAWRGAGFVLAREGAFALVDLDAAAAGAALARPARPAARAARSERARPAPSG